MLYELCPCKTINKFGTSRVCSKYHRQGFNISIETYLEYQENCIMECLVLLGFSMVNFHNTIICRSFRFCSETRILLNLINIIAPKEIWKSDKVKENLMTWTCLMQLENSQIDIHKMNAVK